MKWIKAWLLVLYLILLLIFIITWKDIDNNLIASSDIWGLEDAKDLLQYKFDGRKLKISVDLHTYILKIIIELQWKNLIIHYQIIQKLQLASYYSIKVVR